MSKWNKEHKAQYNKEYHRKHKAKFNKLRAESMRVYRAELCAWIADFKRGKKCPFCPVSHPAALDFHHRRPEEKEFEIGDAAGQCVSIRRVKAEVAKCDLICRSCHAIYHWRQRQMRAALDEWIAEPIGAA